MKLAFRFSLVALTTGALLFGAAGVAMLDREDRDLRKVAEGEAVLLAQGMRTAIGNALRDRQLEDVGEVLEALSAVDERVAIFVYDEEGRLVAASPGAAPAEGTRPSGSMLGTNPVVEFAPGDSPHVLRVALTLREETPIGASALVLEKSLQELERDLSDTRRRIWTTVGAFIVSVSVVTWILCAVYVSRPMRNMVRRMRQVQRGDLRVPATEHRSDEVGEAQREFEVLVAELQKAREQIEHEFEARRRLEVGLRSADKLITLGQLSAVMAHEIGSPLQVLEGRARALQKHSNEPEVVRHNADILVEQTSRITRLVSQMLAITRRKPSQKEQFDPVSVVSSVVRLLELEASRRRVTISLDASESGELFASPDHLQQVALNLLQNALDAAPPESTVDVTLRVRKGEWVLEVHDEGPGIADEIRGNLFEPFYTTKVASGGTGLGLSVVKAIIVEHRGRIEVSDPGEAGCTFRVTLPRNDPSS